MTIKKICKFFYKNYNLFATILTLLILMQFQNSVDVV